MLLQKAASRDTDAQFDWVASANNVGIQGAIETLSNAGNPAGRRDDMLMAGFNYKPASTWAYDAAHHYDRARDVTPQADGTRHTLYGIVDYCFSKRTDVYFEADYTSSAGPRSGSR